MNALGPPIPTSGRPTFVLPALGAAVLERTQGCGYWPLNDGERVSGARGS